MRLRLLISSVAFALSACASTTDRGIAALNAGNMAEAERLFTEAAGRGDSYALNNLGVVAQRRGDRATAVSYYTLAARHGNRMAQQNLAAMGEPIPQADLLAARQRAADDEMARLQRAQQILRDSQPQRPRPAPPTSTDCRTVLIGGVAQTQCTTW